MKKRRRMNVIKASEIKLALREKINAEKKRKDLSLPLLRNECEAEVDELIQGESIKLNP